MHLLHLPHTDFFWLKVRMNKHATTAGLDRATEKPNIVHRTATHHIGLLGEYTIL